MVRSWDLQFHLRQMPWKFPIFVSQALTPDLWEKYKPNSDLSVISPGFLCPFVICEVISQTDKEDRFRMLLQGVAVVRVGNYLMKSGSKRPFFIVAIYFTNMLVAERYIMIQVEPDDPKSKV